MPKLRYLDQAITLELDAGRCNGCGLCVAVCPRGVFALVNGRASLADRGACIECGACARNCAFDAIHVRPGVGCASAIIASWFGGRAKPCCG